MRADKGVAGLGTYGATWTDQGPNNNVFTLYLGNNGALPSWIFPTTLGVNNLPALQWLTHADVIAWTCLTTTEASLYTLNAWTMACVWRFDGDDIQDYDGSPSLYSIHDNVPYDGLLVSRLGDDPSSIISMTYVYSNIGANYARTVGSSRSYNQPHLSVGWLQSNTLYNILDNGMAISNPVAGTITNDLTHNPQIGGNGQTVNSAFNGVIGEMLIYNTSSPELAAALQSYLYAKWFVPAPVLPSPPRVFIPSSRTRLNQHVESFKPLFQPAFTRDSHFFNEGKSK